MERDSLPTTPPRPLLAGFRRTFTRGMAACLVSCFLLVTANQAFGLGKGAVKTTSSLAAAQGAAPPALAGTGACGP